MRVPWHIVTSEVGVDDVGRASPPFLSLPVNVKQVKISTKHNYINDIHMLLSVGEFSFTFNSICFNS